MGRAVGIDLGTTNSVVSVIDAGRPTVISNSQGARTTPSVVAFTRSGEILVGQAAKNQAVTNADRTFSSIKRQMGTNWSAWVDGRTYTPQEISARILMKLKRDTEEYLGEPITDAVITVPSCFNDAQRQATREAGLIAGLNVLRLINEPTAAALAYGLGKAEETALVFDLGGGTFDVSLLDIGENVVDVRATVGNPVLAGDDWDQVIVDHLLDGLRTGHRIELAGDAMAMQRLRQAAEAAKIELSSATLTTISLPYVGMANGEPVHLHTSLTRHQFEEMTKPLLDRCRAPMYQAIKDAAIAIQHIDHVVLVGGSTRMPAVATLVRELTGGKEPHRGVHPDEVVAVGAALQAGVLRGDVRDVLLLDVFPFSLGVRAKDDAMVTLIRRNTTIPTKRSELFTTAGGSTVRPLAPEAKGENKKTTDATSRRAQTAARIEVFQGESANTRDNTSLGAVDLTGIRPAEEDDPKIEVAIDIDANGIVGLVATDLETGNKSEITLTGRDALSAAQLDEMTRAAEAEHRLHHARREKEPKTHDQVETIIHGIDSMIDQESGRLSAFAMDRARAAADAARDALQDPRLSPREVLTMLTTAVGELYAALDQAEGTASEPDKKSVPESVSEVTWDFFVSYTHQDRQWAEWIAWQLDAAGYRVLIQAWHMVAGSHWPVMMQEGIQRSTRTIAVVSEAYLSSVYGQTEWLGAYRADPKGFQRKLIPLRVQECDRPGILAGIVSFDIFNLARDAARATLLRRIAAALAGHDKPGAEPSFPGTDARQSHAVQTPAQQSPPTREPRFPAS